MAALGTATIKVTPDFSAFREATDNEIIGAINPYAKGLLYADLQRMATALREQFTILPL